MMKNYRQWAKDNNVSTYEYHKWLQRNFRGQSLATCDTVENRERYLREKG